MLSQWKNAKRCNHICYNQDKRCYQTNDPRVAAYQYEPDCFQNITYKYFLMQVEAIAKISMEVTSFSLPEDYYMRTKLST